MQIMKNRFINDLLYVMLSNGVVLISGIITGIIVPKLLGVTNYGYYKIFNLYVGYAALLHFGFVDGILLNNANKNYEELDKNKFRLNTRFFILMQIIISIVVVTLSIVYIKNRIYRFIFLMIGIDTIAMNVTSYYQYVSQCTMRFKELSIRKVLQSIMRIISIGMFFILYKTGIILDVSYHIYIITWVSIDIILTIWYVYTYRDITFGKRDKFFNGYKEIIFYFKSGIVLTISYQVANLIFSIDRQFVSIIFDTNTYAVYSFAYSLISIATTIIGSISLVLFPQLKRKSKDKIIENFSNNISLIAILSFGSIICYYPLCGFIKWYLPDYINSLVYFRILLPGLAISSCISTIIFTYYKVLNKNLLYFIVCSIILFISCIFNLFVSEYFKTPEAISIASLIVLIIWFIVGQCYFVKVYNVKWGKNTIYIFIMMSIFYLATISINNEWVGTITYIILFISITYIMYKDVIVMNLNMFNNKQDKLKIS